MEQNQNNGKEKQSLTFTRWPREAKHPDKKPTDKANNGKKDEKDTK